MGPPRRVRYSLVEMGRALNADFVQLLSPMALHPNLDGQRSVRQVAADSRGRGRVRDTRV
jgi:hypothetical protein